MGRIRSNFLLVSVLLYLTACASGGHQSTQEPHSETAGAEQALSQPLLTAENHSTSRRRVAV